MVLPQNINAINGMVFDTAHKPVQNLWIELRDEVDAMIARVQTDATGRFVFRNLSSGTFKVITVTFGTNYVEQSVRVNLYPAVAGAGRGAHYEQLEFVLRTRNTGTPAVTGVVFAQDIPEAAQKLYERAILLLDRENEEGTQEGIRLLREALTKFPTYYLALERLGMEYVKLQKYDLAAETLPRALAINPRGHLSHYALGVTQLQQKQYPAAVNSLRQ
ncbi:MAG: carboxypeptidase regulatory-like domain-containing protein, partial [Blastocatellia bacterium]